MNSISNTCFQLEGVKRPGIEVEHIEREKVDLEMAAPSKPVTTELEEAEVEKPGYKRPVKELTTDELDSAELLIPKVKVSGPRSAVKESVYFFVDGIICLLYFNFSLLLMLEL